MNEEQKVSVVELIKQYSNLFIVEKGELGLIQQAPAHILVKDPTPCRSPIYRYPEKAKVVIANILKDLEERDIIKKNPQQLGCNP